MSSLFEVYDPYTFYLNLSLNWFFISIIALTLFGEFKFFGGSSFSILFIVLKFITDEFKMLFKYKKMMKSVITLFVFLFLYLMIINLIGLVPYVFSCSSHFVFALSFSFPLWAGLMLFGWIKFSNLLFTHMVPLGTPLLLIPFMVMIETVSILIRPWSLSIRLMANLISGHLLMSLLGNCGLSFFLVQLSFFVFEFFVCFIQAYVFSVLLTLYCNEI